MHAPVACIFGKCQRLRNKPVPAQRGAAPEDIAALGRVSQELWLCLKGKNEEKLGYKLDTFSHTTYVCKVSWPEHEFPSPFVPGQAWYFAMRSQSPHGLRASLGIAYPRQRQTIRKDGTQSHGSVFPRNGMPGYRME